MDYPPILDKPVAAGSHTVAFKWPDGSRREETRPGHGGRARLRHRTKGLTA